MPDQINEQAPHLTPSAIAIGLATAYQASQAVIAATKLGIPDVLGAGMKSSGEIARETRTQPELVRRLLRALAALNVVRDLGAGDFELTPVGDCLRADVAHSVRSVVLMYGSETFWQMTASLVECVRTGKNVFQLHYGVDTIFAYLEKQRDLARVFDDAMSGRSALTGLVVAEAYPFAGIRQVVDVAGGHGRMLASILKAHPHLHGTLFDLPRVVESASSSLANEGIADRCEVMGGDMFAAVPTGGDLYLLSRVIHDWDDPHATKILQSCRHAMAPEAKLLIVDRLMPDLVQANPTSQSHVQLDLTMMMWTGGGRERTSGEFKALLSAAGFRLELVIPMRIPDSLVEATPA
jgi:hypothetical protein